jgi:hypothetical protein
MSDESLTRSEAIVLIDERIKSPIKDVTTKIDAMGTSLTKIETAASLIMKFGAGGLVVWVVSQFVQLARSFQH